MLEPGLSITELSKMAEELRELAQGHHTCALRVPWEDWADGEVCQPRAENSHSLHHGLP